MESGLGCYYLKIVDLARKGIFIDDACKETALLVGINFCSRLDGLCRLDKKLFRLNKHG
jgi:hypothetical protein